MTYLTGITDHPADRARARPVRDRIAYRIRTARLLAFRAKIARLSGWPDVAFACTIRGRAHWQAAEFTARQLVILADRGAFAVSALSRWPRWRSPFPEVSR